MALSVVFMNCSRAQRLGTTDVQGNPEKVFATYGDVSLPVSLVDAAVDEQLAKLPPEILTAMPEYRMQVIAGGITQAISGAQIYELAKRQGFNNDDASVKKTFHLTSEQDFRAYATDVLRKAGQLKPNSTDKDLDDLIKTQAQGKTLSQLYTEKSAEVDKNLKDGQKRLEVVLSAGQQYLKEKFEQGINPSDDEIKKQFEKINVKRIIVKTDAKVTPEQAKVKADKAYADLKAGKSFEDVMDAYSEDTPMQGNKKKSENKIPLDQASIDRLPDYKAINKLQPGGYSEPEKVAEGYAIYKYVDKKIELPKDFEKNKANFKTSYLNDQIQKKYQAAVDGLDKEIQPKFEIKAYEAIYRYAKVMAKPAGPDQEKELRAIYDLAKAVDPISDKPDLAVLVEVEAIKRLYDLPGVDKVKLKADRIATFEKFLDKYENWTYRKEVIDNYKELKNGDKAFDNIMAALDKNMTKFDSLGQKTFSDISAAFLEVKTAVGIKPDQESRFRKQQEQWNIDKKKFDAQQAELKKQQDADAKKAAEDAKKAAEEAKKNKKPADNNSSLAPKTTPN